MAERACLLTQIIVASLALAQNGTVPADPAWTADGQRLYRVEDEAGKIGFIDRSAKLVIPHQFDYAADFHEGIAYVRTGSRCGYIDDKAKMAFELPCAVLHCDAHEGLVGYEVPTKLKGMKYVRRRQRGFMNKQGSIAIAPRFNWIEDFNEGLAAVAERYGGKWGYIDHTGQYVIPPTFDHASSFSEGLAAVTVGERVGYIDRTGKFVIPLQLEENGGGFFRDGLALASVGDKLGAIDRQGNWVISAEHNTATSCTEGMCGFSGGAAPLRFYNPRGEVEIEAKFNQFGQFSKGLAPVSLDYKWGYIDRKGELVIPLQFHNAFPFDGALALVSTDSGWDYIDRSGKIVWRGAHF